MVIGPSVQGREALEEASVAVSDRLDLLERGTSADMVLVTADVSLDDVADLASRVGPDGQILLLLRSRWWGNARKVRRTNRHLARLGVHVQEALWVGESLPDPNVAVPFGDPATLRWFAAHGFTPWSRRQAAGVCLMRLGLLSLGAPLVLPGIVLIGRPSTSGSRP